MELEPCPSRPKCVSTQAGRKDIDHYIRPLRIGDLAPDRVLNVVADTINANRRARISARSCDMVEAVFVSRILRLRSDVTFTVDAAAGLLNFRSASRFGWHDMHGNRKRMEDLVPAISLRLREPVAPRQGRPAVVVSVAEVAAE